MPCVMRPKIRVWYVQHIARKAYGDEPTTDITEIRHVDVELDETIRLEGIINPIKLERIMVPA